jgi:hypothetical protein
MVDVGRDPASGRRRQRTKGGYRTKKEAQQALAAVIRTLGDGSPTSHAIRRRSKSGSSGGSARWRRRFGRRRCVITRTVCRVSGSSRSDAVAVVASARRRRAVRGAVEGRRIAVAERSRRRPFATFTSRCVGRWPTPSPRSRVAQRRRAGEAAGAGSSRDRDVDRRRGAHGSSLRSTVTGWRLRIGCSRDRDASR